MTSQPDFKYFPHEGYINKNWAPEKISYQDLQSIAKAQALAEKHGLIKKPHSEYFLPMLLAENMPGFYGLTNPYSGQGADAFANQARMLNLKPVHSIKNGQKHWEYKPYKGKLTPEQMEHNARLAALTFVIKSKNATPEEAVGKYTGSTKTRYAIDKVLRLKNFLDNSANMELVAAYRQLLNSENKILPASLFKEKKEK